MADWRKLGATSNKVRFPLKNSSTGAPLTGLSSASAGLIISTIADNEATATAYTQAGSTIESITTLGTFAAPTASKCRFKEVDATNHPGLYEFQFADARFAVASSQRLVISVSGAASLLATDYEILLTSVDPFDAVRFGLSIWNGITSLAQWLGLMAGKQTGDTTARNEIRATGAGSGTYDEATDSQEATRDYAAPASTALSTAQWTNGRAAALDNLDVVLSTRAPASTALSTVQWTNARAALLDNLVNLDAAVSTRAPSATALSTANWTNARALLLDNLVNLDVAVSSRATPTDAYNATVQAVFTDTYGEPTGAPALADSLAGKTGRLYQALRNQIIVDSGAGELQFYNNAGVLLWRKAVSDVAGVYTEQKGTT